VRRNFLRAPQNAGDYTADLVRVIGLLGVIAAGIWWTWTDAGILALALPAVLVPRSLGTRAWFDITFGVVVLAAAWSNVLDLYTTVPGWDTVLHFTCTGLIATVAYLLLARVGIVPPARDATVGRRSAIVLGVIIALAASAIWELVEWAGYTFVSDDIFVAYADTIGDMAAGGLGGLAGGLLLAFLPIVRADAS
jgi:Predicted membrane protein (DUF2238)